MSWTNFDEVSEDDPSYFQITTEVTFDELLTNQHLLLDDEVESSTTNPEECRKQFSLNCLE